MVHHATVAALTWIGGGRSASIGLVDDFLTSAERRLVKVDALMRKDGNEKGA